MFHNFPNFKSHFCKNDQCLNRPQFFLYHIQIFKFQNKGTNFPFHINLQTIYHFLKIKIFIMKIPQKLPVYF